MTPPADRGRRTARAYAVLTWTYAAGFGLPVGPVSIHLLRRGSLPWFGDLFPMYGGPWSGRLTPAGLVRVLAGYLALLVLTTWLAGRVRRGSRRATAFSAALLPVEAVYWVGFALPIPWALGAARAALLAVTWRARSRVPERTVRRPAGPTPSNHSNV